MPDLQSKARIFIVPVILLGIFFAYMVAVQFASPDMPDNDGYYHIKMAYLMRTEGLKPDFVWLPLTILSPREFYDHHFLFHVALIPFTYGDLRMGAKWAAVIFPTLAFMSVWWLFYRQRVPYAGLWALGLLAISQAFIFRMSITRAQSLSLAFLALGLGWMLDGKHARLAVLAFLYVWTYDAFVLLPVLALLYAGASWLLERRLEWRPLSYTVLGTVLGLLVNPYFPFDIIFVFRHLLPKLTETTAVRVGNEWFPYTTAQLLENSPLALAAFVSGVIALGLRGERMEVRTAMALFAAVLFGWMFFQARRFVEYFPPFALIFAALAWAPMLPVVNAPDEVRGNDRNRGNLPPLRSLRRLSTSRISTRQWLHAVSLFLILLFSIPITLRGAQESIRDSKPYDLYAEASAWLQANTPAGERVFQTDWDDFPRLFYYNTHNTYLVGLDPTYLQLYNDELYDLWVAITRGEVENLSQVIITRFAARYVMSDLNHKNFLSRASEDPGMWEVYRDDQAVIFEIIQE